MTSATRLVNVGVVPEQAKEIVKGVADSYDTIKVPSITNGAFVFPGGTLKDFAEYVADKLKA